VKLYIVYSQKNKGRTRHIGAIHNEVMPGVKIVCQR